MTDTEAHTEATRRWGTWARHSVGFGPGAYQVADDNPAHTFCYGLGVTWEAAFADFDRREKGNKTGSAE